MKTYAAMLRGINVGGNRKVPMKDLRQLAESLGFSDVTTYIASGNLFFRGAPQSEAGIVRALEAGIEKRFGFSVPVVVRTHQELVETAANNPFVKRGSDTARLYVSFLAATPTKAALAGLDGKRSPPDEVVVRGRDIYMHCPNGSAETRFTVDYFERVLGSTATARNWNTVQKLVELTAE